MQTKIKHTYKRNYKDIGDKKFEFIYNLLDNTHKVREVSENEWFSFKTPKKGPHKGRQIIYESTKAIKNSACKRLTYIPKDLNEKRKGSRFIRFGVFPLSEVFDNINKGILNYKDEDGTEIMVKMKSQRYKVFRESLVCTKCGLTGKYFALEIDKQNFRNGSRKFHFNLYAVNENGEEVLMTKDHIIPRAKDGKNRLDNYQTMCKWCNEEKADKLEGELE